jgi:hypothetical protein
MATLPKVIGRDFIEFMGQDFIEGFLVIAVDYLNLKPSRWTGWASSRGAAAGFEVCMRLPQNGKPPLNAVFETELTTTMPWRELSKKTTAIY